MPTPQLVWLRRDLRLADHPALAAANHPLLVYIHAPQEETPWEPGAASHWWLHHSLTALDADLARRGSRLIRRSGPSAAALLALCRATGATTIHATRLHEPATRARDRAVAERLQAEGITLILHEGALLLPPEAIVSAAGTPYRVFTPYWRSLQTQLTATPPRPAPARLPAPPGDLASEPLAAWGLLPRLNWADGFTTHWQPGEAGGQQQLERFLEAALCGYGAGRDRPALAATSRLSPHLHFGELTPRQLLAAVTAEPRCEADKESYLRELAWREFAHYLLHHLPHTAEQPLDRRFEQFPWRADDGSLLRAWQRGETGIPLVDAGMRELWQTGWQHNRVRMVVGSFLTKNLRLPWQAGARWFWQTLVDADLANNSLGWQWIAGCGADAAPYFRIFNPVLQGEKFDPAGVYLRRYLPELAQLPDRFIHRPWALPAREVTRLGFQLGRDYPAPIVDLARSREEALAAWKGLGRGP